MRRHLATATVALLAVVAVIVLVRGLTGAHPTIGKLERLREGMRYQEVVQILGPPTRLVEGTGPADLRRGRPGADDTGLYEWKGGTAIILVGFVHGRVALIQSNLRR